MRFLQASVIAIALAGPSASRAAAEDVQLRARAVQLMNHAHVVSTPNTRGRIVQTVATFRSTSDGNSASGLYTRLRGATGYLRQEITLGDFHASMVGVKMQEATIGDWRKPPAAVKQLMQLVPFSVGEFDAKDVVRRIEATNVSGAPATCVFFEAIEGDNREPGDICFDDASGVILQAHTGLQTYRYSNFYEHAGARMPGHIDYEERGGLTLSIDITTFILDTLPEDAFAFPPEAKVHTLCARYSEPLPLVVPQPRAVGGDGAPVTTVVIHATVAADGAVNGPRIARSPKPELNDEALRTVSGWKFQAGTCNGQPVPYPWDLEVKFQGR